MIETEIAGGVIGGYWAIGRLNSAIPPVKVMTIDSTVAKMGRSMKKCEKATSPFSSPSNGTLLLVPHDGGSPSTLFPAGRFLTWADCPVGFSARLGLLWALSAASDWSRVGMVIFAVSICVRMHLLQGADDHPFAVFQTFGDRPAGRPLQIGPC